MANPEITPDRNGMDDLNQRIAEAFGVYALRKDIPDPITVMGDQAYSTRYLAREAYLGTELGRRMIGVARSTLDHFPNPKDQVRILGMISGELV